MDQPIITTGVLQPLMVQTYQRYLPSAFDDSLSILEKVNRTIIQLNQIGQLSNDVLDQWNQVMTWVMADGLNGSIDNKIDTMLQDGTLATVIGSTITDLQTQFNNLNTTLTGEYNTLSGNVSTNGTSISTNATNITNLQTSVNRMKYYILPEDYGAKGDGVTDDTQALLNAIASIGSGKKGILSLKPNATYLIHQTIELPDYVSLEGNGALIKGGAVWNNVSVGASVPQTTLLYVKGREPNAGTDLTMSTRFIKDLQIDGGTSSNNYTGLYMGTPDQSVITQSSCVNYAVYQCEFSNISISNVAEGMFLAEVWGSKFETINTSYIGDCGLKIQGQIVNNTFTGCQFSGLNNAVYVDGATYNGSIRRPEGNMFYGGFIGSAKWGVNIVRGLAFRFVGCTIDLNSLFAVTGQDMSDVQFDHCWIYCTARAVDIQAMSTTANGTFVNFTGCNISTDGTTDPYSTYVHVRQNGVNFNGCKFNGVMYWDDASSGNVMNCFWDGTPDATNRILKHGTGIVGMTRNTFKQDGSNITTGTV